MYYLFLLIMFVSITYFLVAQRVFDFFNIAVFSGAFYFSPAVFGYAYNPYLNVCDALTSTQYEIFIAYFFLFSMGAMLKDWLCLRKEALMGRFAEKKSEDHTNHAIESFTNGVLVIIYLCSFFYLVYTLGVNAFSSDKLLIMSQLGIGFKLFCSSLLIGIIFWYKKSKWLFMLVMLGFLYTLFISYRFIFILGLLSIITFYFSRQNRQNFFLKNWKILIFIFLIAIFLFIYKDMYVSYKTFDFNMIIKSLMANAHNPQRLFIHAEPMIIQENLNLIVQYDYRVSPHYLINNFLILLLPFSSKLGLHAVSFNQLFQPVFYDGYKYGVAANIWAEMYALGGLTLVYIFMLLLVGLCFWMSYAIKQLSQNLAAVVIPIGVIFFFYIQRNDLTFTLNLARNVFLIWGLANIIAYGLVKLKTSDRK